MGDNWRKPRALASGPFLSTTFGVILVATVSPACALIVNQRVTTTDSILACWRHSDMHALLYVGYAMKIHEQLQFKWDALQDGRCFEIEEGESLQVEMVIRNPYQALVRLRKPGAARRFWSTTFVLENHSNFIADSQ